MSTEDATHTQQQTAQPVTDAARKSMRQRHLAIIATAIVGVRTARAVESLERSTRQLRAATDVLTGTDENVARTAGDGFLAFWKRNVSRVFGIEPAPTADSATGSAPVPANTQKSASPVATTTIVDHANLTVLQAVAYAAEQLGAATAMDVVAEAIALMGSPSA